MCVCRFSTRVLAPKRHTTTCLHSHRLKKLFRPDSGERIVIAPASTPVDAVAVTRKGAMQDLFDSKIVLALHEMGVLADLYLSMLDTLLSAAFRSVGVSLPPPSKPPPRRMPTRRLLRELLECS